MMKIMVNVNLPDHIKTKKLGKLLNISATTALGHVVTLWCKVMRLAETGVLAQWDVSELAEASNWRGSEGTFANALMEAGFVEKKNDTYLVHDWQEHQGNWFEKRLLWKERQRRYRSRLIEKIKQNENNGPTTESHHESALKKFREKDHA